MTPDLIMDYVDQLAVIQPRWQAWREARKKYGYQKTYLAYLKSEQWRDFRDAVLKNYPTCECCGKNESSEVHHLDYRYVYFENRGFVQAVCRSCHEAMTGIDNWERRERNAK